MLAALTGLLPVFVIEFALRIAGVESGMHDPYAEFGGVTPVFERAGPVYRTAKAREPFLAPQTFPAVKPGYRIFCFGGSTVHGRPYQTPTAFPAWLQIELRNRAPGQACEVINCGGISYASYRIVPMVREVLDYEPDAIVLATGHNEFLEDRTYHEIKRRSWLRRRLDGLRIVAVGRGLLQPARPRPGQTPAEGGFKTRLDQRNGYASYHRDEAWHTAVIQQFEASVREIAGLCRQREVPLILVQLGSNLRDCPPFKSEHRSGLAAEEEQKWLEWYERARAREPSDPEAAWDVYDRAAQIDSEFALLSYRRAKTADRLGRTDGLAKLYVKAKDDDVCPLRLKESQHAVLRDLAAEFQLILVDARQEIAALAPDGIPGFDWYLDHVHPTIGGHQKIAQAIAAKMKEAGLLPAMNEWDAAERARYYQRHFQSLDARYLRDGARRLEWLDNWARREKLAAEVAPRDGADHIRLGIRRLDFGAENEARKSFDEALSMDPKGARQRISEHVSELESQGRLAAAAGLRAWLESR